VFCRGEQLINMRDRIIGLDILARNAPSGLRKSFCGSVTRRAVRPSTISKPESGRPLSSAIALLPTRAIASTAVKARMLTRISFEKADPRR
tara:strand:- start:52085 stop:52357 length:273 start_codon:yes stop_codon:yes gene_type:complete